MTQLNNNITFPFSRLGLQFYFILIRMLLCMLHGPWSMKNMLYMPYYAVHYLHMQFLSYYELRINFIHTFSHVLIFFKQGNLLKLESSTTHKNVICCYLNTYLIWAKCSDGIHNVIYYSFLSPFPFLSVIH